ncbi:MAG TPA: flagellar biosynthetic protein FliR [Anaeromyxobacteraceae bacterium]|nr:flagellar biosynthetic protein FliR [Anaeromyxobacteraceae bacterium]
MSALPDMAALLAPHLAAVALHALRLLPVALLSPFLGGPLVPAPIRLTLAAGLGAAVHLASGTQPVAAGGLADLAAMAGRELALGAGLGWLASLPLEAARAGGRLVDTLRGATLAELHVAPVRQRETAVGDLLAQWAVVLAGWSGADRLVMGSVVGSFASLPVGAAAPAGALLETALRGSAALAAAALCLGAPAAAGLLAADLALALASRATPWLGVPGAAQPLRAGLGLAAVALPAAVLGGKLVALAADAAAMAARLAGGSGP